MGSASDSRCDSECYCCAQGGDGLIPTGCLCKGESVRHVHIACLRQEMLARPHGRRADYRCAVCGGGFAEPVVGALEALDLERVRVLSEEQVKLQRTVEQGIRSSSNEWRIKTSAFAMSIIVCGAVAIGVLNY